MKRLTKSKAFWALGCLALLAVCGCSCFKPARLNAAKSLTICGPAAAQLGEKMAREGKRQYEEGLLNSAERVLEKAVQIDPTNQKAWYYLHCVQESLYGAEKKQQYWRDRVKRNADAEEVTQLPAEPRASPNGGPKASTAYSGAGEGPPSGELRRWAT